MGMLLIKTSPCCYIEHPDVLHNNIRMLCIPIHILLPDKNVIINTLYTYIFYRKKSMILNRLLHVVYNLVNKQWNNVYITKFISGRILHL